MNNFYKGGVRGSHGENKLTYMKDNIAFTSEVYINQIGQQYSVYTVLRVGEKKSTSVTKKIVIKDFSNFKAINLMKRIVVGNKVYNVILTIGPEIP